MPQAPSDKYGRAIDPHTGQITRGAGVGAKPVQSESRADAYRRQKKGSRELYPGEHENEAKKLEAEDAKTSPAPSPSPTATAVPVEEKKRAPIKPRI